MKNIAILIIAIILLVLPVGCEKESNDLPCEPSCGVVVRRGFASEVANYYEIYVENECSKKTKGYRVSQSDYYAYDKGDHICSEDGTTWIRKN